MSEKKYKRGKPRAQESCSECGTRFLNPNEARGVGHRVCEECLEREEL